MPTDIVRAVREARWFVAAISTATEFDLWCERVDTLAHARTIAALMEVETGRTAAIYALTADGSRVLVPASVPS